MTTASSEPDRTPERHHLAAWLLFPFAIFPFVALVTYDWRAIAALNMPPQPTSNMIGALGDFFAYYGYTLFGLAIWLVPALCIVAGLCLVAGRRMNPWRRNAWFGVLLVAVSCLLQVFGNHASWIARLTHHLNVSDTGGAVGYLLMTRLLTPLLSDFGSSVLMCVLALFAIIAAVGFHNIAALCVFVFRWSTDGVLPRPSAAGTGADGATAEDAPSDPQRTAYEAARLAKAEAKRQREEEKAAARRQREEERARKKAEREQRRLELQKAKEVVLAGDHRQEPVLTQPGLFPNEPAPAPAAPKKAPRGAAVPAAEPPLTETTPYVLPGTDLLKPLTPSVADHGNVEELSNILISTLKIFDVEATLSYTVPGPVVTKYAIELAPGTRFNTVTSLSNELMGALRARSLRIEAPIPGENRVGIEVPNRKPAGISFREIFESDAWRKSKAELPLLFGKDAAGHELVADLASMPHMLVAGATGQGKSVCLNSLICGLLMTRTPDQLKFIMVDPKMVEFTPYAAIPHLIVPVITDNQKVVFSLHWAVAEMEKRLKLLKNAGVRNIYDFNHRKALTQTDMFGNNAAIGADLPKTLPYIVIIIDEAADLIGQCGKDVNPDIQRLTQKARATGIHLILATQRPDAKIITGTIKANIPGRVAFKTASAVDSRTILDEVGAENLIGKGDMLFRGKDNTLVRAQGAWIGDEEIANVTHFIEQHSTTAFDARFAAKLSTIKEEEVDIYADDTSGSDESSAPKEEAAEARAQIKADENASDFKKALECIIDAKRASTSYFQRKFGWGYNHAAKIIDQLESAGVVGPQQGLGPRPILLDQDQLVAILNGDNASAAEAVEEPPAENAEPEEPEQTDEEVMG